MAEYKKTKPLHGSEKVMGGNLIGKTDTDYFYFLCPECGDTTILRILDFSIVHEVTTEHYQELRPKAKKEFIVAFKLYCPKCKLRDFVKISNIGWQGGRLKDVLERLFKNSKLNQN